mmetsp:Transcript_23883/g.70503  ORF Transcript_23883/g.70503 Transcript_23883/m.70503 type:complete len:83 (-) Transcript_23883:731-979(-)
MKHCRPYCGCEHWGSKSFLNRVKSLIKWEKCTTASSNSPTENRPEKWERKETRRDFVCRSTGEVNHYHSSQSFKEYNEYHLV